MLASFWEVRPADGHQAGPAHNIDCCTETVFIGPGAAGAGPVMTFLIGNIGEAVREPGIQMRQQRLVKSLLFGLIQSGQVSVAQQQPRYIGVALGGSGGPTTKAMPTALCP